MVEFTTKLENIDENELHGFFVGWPNPPATAQFLELLKGSYRVILAMEGKKVIGFITAISDGVLSAYIPLLEVLPDYKSQGIGRELVSKMKSELNHLYMIDLLCDKELVSYYEKQGMQKATGAFLRNYQNQSGYCE